MKTVLDYDPLTGHKCVMTVEDGKTYITNEQDATSIIESATELRNDTDYSAAGIKNDMWHYARVPLDTLLEMEQKHGVKCVSGQVDWKAFFRCINTHYPKLKATTKTHA